MVVASQSSTYVIAFQTILIWVWPARWIWTEWNAIRRVFMTSSQ